MRNKKIKRLYECVISFQSLNCLKIKNLSSNFGCQSSDTFFKIESGKLKYKLVTQIHTVLSKIDLHRHSPLNCLILLVKRPKINSVSTSKPFKIPEHQGLSLKKSDNIQHRMVFIKNVLINTETLKISNFYFHEQCSPFIFLTVLHRFLE